MCNIIENSYFLDSSNKWDKFYVYTPSRMSTHFRVIPVVVGDICVIVY